MELLINIGIGILGILLYVAFASRSKIFKPEYTIAGHFKENYRRWGWATSILVMIAVLLHVEPTLEDAIKTFTGLDLGTTHTAYFSLAIALSALVRGEVDKQ